MDEELLRIIDLFDDDEVTTADKIDRPAAASYREMFDDFNARNPFAGGGMLVQPGFGGTRQGYKEDKYITPARRTGAEGFQGQKFISVKDPTYSDGRKRVKTPEYKKYLKIELEKSKKRPDRYKQMSNPRREPGLLRIAEAMQQADIYDDAEYMMPNKKAMKVKEKDFDRRIFNIKAETRADEKAGKKYIEGHAALFNEETWIGDFREYIKPNAFRDVLSNDVRVLFNHDPNQILARTKNNTAQIKQDSKGLHYRFEVPNTTLGNDLYELVNSGIINQSSFGFIIEDEKWNRDEKGAVREITKVGRLFDVSPVSFPAYEQTNDLAVAKRKYNFFKEKENFDKEEKDLVQRSLLALKLNLIKLNNNK